MLVVFAAFCCPHRTAGAKLAGISVLLKDA